MGEDLTKSGKKIIINLQSIIDDGGEKERHSIEQVGYFHNRNELDVITFIEETNDGETIHHLLSIYPNKVNIKRSGAIQMNQVFEINEATEGMMRLPHGNILMETYTQVIDYKSILTHKRGELHIVYEIKMNGQPARNHQLQLIYNKEDAK